MEKHFSKKIISLLLCMSVCIIPLFTVNCNAVETVSENINADIPYIHVVGLMSSDIYENPDDPESNTVWPPETNSIVKNVFKLLPPIFSLIITKNYDRFSDKLVTILNDVLSPTYLSNSGTVDNTSGIRFEWPKPEEITRNSKLTFEYDWRVDPLEEAENLDKFINYVLECSGCSQVVLECHSYGGVITYTYCTIKGTDKLRSVLFNASAVYGETFTGDLCQGKLIIDSEALTEYLKAAFSNDDSSKFLSWLMDALYKTGITGKLCSVVNKVINNTHDKLYKEVIFPMFGGWPSIWSMVKEEDYEASVDYMFNKFYGNDGIDHSGLYNKVENFNNTVRKNREKTLNNINDNCNLYVVCRYGYTSMFCTPSWKIANDMIVDVKNASFGATTSQFGETLSSEYLSNIRNEYISPDKTVDASTCLFPEQTWFIKNLVHMRSRECTDKMFEILLYSENQENVNTFSEYPRYMTFDVEGATLIPNN